MDHEEQIKFREKLFGNIKFIRELYKRNLLSDIILIKVFTDLLRI